MNEKIQNPKTEVPQGKNMNDQNYLNDILETEKNMCINMCIALNEASNEDLEDTLYDFFEDIKESQRELYELAFKKGWYSLEKEKPEKINQKYNELYTMINELNQG